VTAATDPERELLQAALRGNAAAAANLTRSLSDLVWTACLHVSQDKPSAEAAFRDVMTALKADNFARLKGFDGRARFRVYAVLVVRDLLTERVIKLLALNATAGWRSFEAFFADDMRRIILRNLPGTNHQQNREDAYQSVCEALLKNDLQRLKAYSGRGSPSGFILHVIQNLVIDHVRTIVPRRRLPAPIQHLAALAASWSIYWREGEHPASPPAPPAAMIESYAPAVAKTESARTDSKKTEGAKTESASPTPALADAPAPPAAPKPALAARQPCEPRDQLREALRTRSSAVAEARKDEKRDDKQDVKQADGLRAGNGCDGAPADDADAAIRQAREDAERARQNAATPSAAAPAGSAPAAAAIGAVQADKAPAQAAPAEPRFGAGGLPADSSTRPAAKPSARSRALAR
jgi:DNA-directed RNA polymerase specialized sigma24 family protein